MPTIRKIREVSHIVVTAHSAHNNNAAGPLTQELILPATFFSGEGCQLAHSCLQCQKNIRFTMGYGAIIGAKTWSLRKLANQREFLDEVGQLLHLKLEAPTEQGVETAHYYTAVLDVALVGYYRCVHCAAHYLVGYARHGVANEGRGTPESATMHVQCIAQIIAEEQALLSIFK